MNVFRAAVVVLAVVVVVIVAIVGAALRDMLRSMAGGVD
jgi:hypothetical protein